MFKQIHFIHLFVKIYSHSKFNAIIPLKKVGIEATKEKSEEYSNTWSFPHGK